MFFSTLAASSLLASMAAALPTAQPGINRHPHRVVLKPVVHPGVDRADLSNLKATKDAKMHFDSDPNPRMNSSTATIFAPTAEYPIVQLENTKYISSVSCTDNNAKIIFNNQTAYQEAVADWQKLDGFVMLSYDPECGAGHSADKNDFVLVKDTTADDSSMTVSAAIQFVDYATAIGSNTTVTTVYGQYVAPTQHLAARGDYSKSETFNWNEYPTNTLSDSEFGPGFQIYSGDTMDVICVGCGTKGTLTMTGKISFSIFSGVSDVEIDLSGNMDLTMQIGLNAKGVSHTFPIADISLAQIPLDPISIPDIVTIGPQIDISAGADIEISATGSMLIGAEFSWPNVQSTLVLDGDGQSGGSGWEPTMTPVEKISGSVAATLDLHLPVEFAIGVDIADGLWKKNLGVIDTPGLQLTANASNVGDCHGVELSADVYNNVDADILGFTTIDLAAWTTTLFSTCLGSTSTPGSTPVSTPGSTPVTTPRNSPTSSPNSTPTPPKSTPKGSPYPTSKPTPPQSTPKGSPSPTTPKPPKTTPKGSPYPTTTPKPPPVTTPKGTPYPTSKPNSPPPPPVSSPKPPVSSPNPPPPPPPPASSYPTTSAPAGTPYPAKRAEKVRNGKHYRQVV